MKYQKKFIVLCLGFIFFPAITFAQLSFGPYVEDGWWYNPAESGRGFNIEMQDNTIFIAVFVYNNDGQPEWYSGAGVFDSNTKTVQLMLDRYQDGQCITCSYTSPDRQAGFAGPVTIKFDTPTAATLSWDGGTINIQRFYFIPQFLDPLEFLLGGWHLVVTQASGIYTADKLAMDLRLEDDGSSFIDGFRLGDDRAAIGTYEADSEVYFILVDDSDDFYAIYGFIMSKNTMKGCYELFPKNGAPADTCALFMGEREASRTEVASGNGPFKSMSTAADSSAGGFRNKLNWMIYQQQQQQQQTAAIAAELVTDSLFVANSAVIKRLLNQLQKN